MRDPEIIEAELIEISAIADDTIKFERIIARRRGHLYRYGHRGCHTLCSHCCRYGRATRSPTANSAPLQ
jgi:hypothetical protein